MTSLPSSIITKTSTNRNLIFISFSQFATTFSFNFIFVFLPFYIFRISPYSSQATLFWIGAIMGVTGLCTAMTSPFWGSLTHRLSPKMLYLRVLVVHLVTFFLMGFTENLYVLLILRILQGVLGGVSTTGLIIVSSSSPKERISSHIGFYQSSITFGQLVGPPIGALAAATFGYRGAFVSASGVVFAAFIFCYLYVTDVSRLPRETKALGKTMIDKRVVIGWALSFTAQIQLMFLPSILPKVFEGFNTQQTMALKLAGIVVMLYTGTAMIGTYVWSSLSKRVGLNKMITFVFLSGILLQSVFVLSRGVFDFTLIRMIQTGLVAVTMPLVISLFVGELKGSTIGLLNSARFAGNALGPMVATSVLAFSNLTTLYLFISLISLMAFLAYRFLFK
jgi:DHA1 family multidrug resistance protein-like MFS transporter